MFSLLKFAELEPPKIVPSCWLYEEKLIVEWPPYDDTRQIRKAIVNCDSPQDDWETYPYEKILFRTSKQPNKYNVTHMCKIYVTYSPQLNNVLLTLVVKYMVLAIFYSTQYKCYIIYVLYNSYIVE